MNFTKQAAMSAAALVVSASAALADATVTVCTGPGGTNCATDEIPLARGQAINWCVDGSRVSKSVSSARGEQSATDALTGLYNIARHAAEAVERRGVTVTGYQAEMEGCDGSWEDYCTTVTVGTVTTQGVSVPDPNRLIARLTGQQPQSCGLFGSTHGLYPLPR